MKTPRFWQTKNFISDCLLPISFFYGLGTKKRLLKKGRSVSVPVICCGNITAGGAGKTSLALELGKYFLQNKEKPFFLTRGYKGSEKNTRMVTPEDNFKTVGDEALLLAHLAPTIISKNRYEAAMLAIEKGASLLIMDDGLQNPTLYKDFSFLLIDGKFGLGNQRFIPSGPLREPLSEALKRVKAIVIMGSDENNNFILEDNFGDLPVLRARIKAFIPEEIKASNLVAFAGLAYPEKFFTTLHQENLFPILEKSFPDHHSFSFSELSFLEKYAQRSDAQLICTAKDFVRLPHEFQKKIVPIHISLLWDEPYLFESLLKNEVLWLKK